MVEINFNAYAYPFKRRNKIDENDVGCSICSPAICGKLDCSFYKYIMDPRTPRELNEKISRGIRNAFAVKNCRSCGGDLSNAEIMMYEHPGGWDMKKFGFEKRQWLYAVCGKCGLQISLWKIGVDKDFLF